MDSNALQNLIAQVRETTAALAEAEQKIATAKADLAQQDLKARLDASIERSTNPTAKPASSGWLAAG